MKNPFLRHWFRPVFDADGALTQIRIAVPDSAVKEGLVLRVLPVAELSVQAQPSTPESGYQLVFQDANTTRLTMNFINEKDRRRAVDEIRRALSGSGRHRLRRSADTALAGAGVMAMLVVVVIVGLYLIGVNAQRVSDAMAQSINDATAGAAADVVQKTAPTPPAPAPSWTPSGATGRDG